MSSPIHTSVAQVIDDLFGVPANALHDDVELQDGLQLDSLSVIELQVAIEEAETLPETARGEGGFGSTGGMSARS